MKKLLAILSIAVLLCSCAAEKRLARFLERHPELHRIDTVYYHDTIVRPAEANTVNLTLSELIAMDSIAGVALTENQDTCLAAHGGISELIRVQNEAKSTLEAGGMLNPEGIDAVFELDKNLRSRGSSPEGSAVIVANALYIQELMKMKLTRSGYDE